MESIPVTRHECDLLREALRLLAAKKEAEAQSPLVQSHSLRLATKRQQLADVNRLNEKVVAKIRYFEKYNVST